MVSPFGSAGIHAANGTNHTWLPYSDGRNYIRGTTIIADDGSNVGIGTTAPAYKLDVSGSLRATGSIAATDLIQSNLYVEAPFASFKTSDAGYGALFAVLALESGSTRGIEAKVSSAQGTGGRFTNTNASGTALAAVVGSTTVMDVDAAGVHAGPGMTGTPYAYGYISSSCLLHKVSSNVTACSKGSTGAYNISLAGTDYCSDQFVTIVTSQSVSALVPYAGSANSAAGPECSTSRCETSPAPLPMRLSTSWCSSL